MTSVVFTTGGPEWRVEGGNLTVGLVAEDADGARREETLSFSLPEGWHAHPDCVAAALSTLCGRKYKEIGFDFGISDRARGLVERAYGVKVAAGGPAVAPRPPGDAVALNFSGGFDSLSAHALAGDVKLISMDFGGAFAREHDYFSRFDTLICRTDLRSKGFGLNDWRFMGSGSLLLADFLGLGTVGFGTIFEAATWNFRAGEAGSAPAPDGPFNAASLVSTSWIRMLTEFGTAMVVLRFMPEEVAASLRSLAAGGSEKFHRKQLLVRIASETLGLPMPDIGDLVLPKEKAKFGKAFTVDFLSLFFLQRLGRGRVEEFMEGLPDDDALRGILDADLGFYLKYNPNFLGHVPRQFRTALLARLDEAGLEPFNERDYASFAAVRRFISSYHPIPA